MHPAAEQILRAVAPYRVVTDLKVPLENRDGLLFTKDPQNPKNEFQISRREFIAATYGNSNPGCNIFDFLKLHLGSYEKAVDYVLDSYHNLIQAPGGLSIDSVRSALIDSLTDARLQFEEVLALRNGLRHHEHLSAVYVYCRGKGISPDHSWMMFYAAHGRKLNPLLQYCSAAREFDADEVYLIYPFLKKERASSKLAAGWGNLICLSLNRRCFLVYLRRLLQSSSALISTKNGLVTIFACFVVN